MRTEQWIKKLGGHAGELFVCAELSKRGIPNALSPENFSDDDILVGNKNGTEVGFVQVKSSHPDRSRSFILNEKHEFWQTAAEGHLCVFVSLGSTLSNEGPSYWIAEKKEVGLACLKNAGHGTANWERRFYTKDLPTEWKSRWSLFDRFKHAP